MTDADELTAWLVDAVESGDRRRALEAMRKKLSQVLALSVGREAAAIAKELREVMQELERIPDGGEVSKTDDLAKRRESRRKAAGL